MKSLDRDWYSGLLLLLVVAGIYAPFVNNPLLFDDLGLFGTGGISNRADVETIFGLRGLPYFTFGATWVFFGNEPLVHRLINIMLHGVNTLLVWMVLRYWFCLFLGKEQANKSYFPILFGALIFASHPLAVYGTGYLIQRTILLSTMFVLLMQLFYLRALVNGKVALLFAAVLAYLCAVFSKEHAILAPIILLPLTMLFWSKNSPSIRSLLLTWLGFFAVAMWMLLRMKGILGTTYEPDALQLFSLQQVAKSAGELHVLSVLTQSGLFFKYILLMLVPNPAWMSIDMREGFIQELGAWGGWIRLLAFCGFGALGAWCLFKKGIFGLVGLAILFLWSNFLVEFSTVRVQEIFVLYRAYLWLPACALVLAVLLRSINGKWQFAIGMVIVTILAAISMNRLWVMSDDYRTWDEAARLLKHENASGSPRIFYERARASLAKGDWVAAVGDYKKALDLDGENNRVRMALATAYFTGGQFETALMELDAILEKEPASAKAHYNRSIVLDRMGRPGTQEALIRSCELGNVVACLTLSLKYKKQQ
jgi:hypothetical protein